jgi:hypothetical protein
MSKGSIKRTVKFLSKSCIYTAWLQSPSGDLWQEYDSADDNAVCTPDWTAASEKPIIEFVAVSSRTAVGETSVADGDITWYVNDEELAFSGGVSTGSWAGIFQKTTNSGRQCLKILKNVAIASGFASITVKAAAAITDGTNYDTIQATTTIDIQQTSGQAYRAVIVAGDSNNFVINTDGGSCKLKAVVLFNGTIRETTGMTYKWYALSGAAWLDLGLTTQTITVNEGDINVYGEYKVEVSIPEVESVLTDVQGVMDTTDPYTIDARPTPENESITQDSGGKVTYNPRLMTRSGTVVSPQPTFSYAIRDGQGTLIETTNEVTEAMCVQAGGDVSIIITAED